MLIDLRLLTQLTTTFRLVINSIIITYAMKAFQSLRTISRKENSWCASILSPLKSLPLLLKCRRGPSLDSYCLYCQFSVVNGLRNIISCLHKPWIFLFFIFFQFAGVSWIRHQFVLGPKTTTSEDSTFQWVDWLPLSSFICMDTCPVIHVTPLIGLTGAAVTRCRLKSALP